MNNNVTENLEKETQQDQYLDGHLFVERTDRLMEGEELQQWLRDHAEDYEFDEEMEDEE